MNTSRWILIAEDNANDADLALRALKLNHQSLEAVIVRDGREALDCLLHKGEFAQRSTGQPAFVLLDLKMPKMDGFAVLQEIKSNSQLKVIPVVIFTSSREQKDIASCYDTGANAYVVKPLNFREFAATLKSIDSFWMVLNEPPPEVMTSEMQVTQTATPLARAA
jgi:CheY-like chemotaxis protein